MGVLFGARERRSQTFPEPPIPPFPGADMFGRTSVASTPDKALGVPTVWACVGLLANAVSMLPLETFRRTSNVPARITDPAVVTSPSGDLTQSEWLHILMVSLLLRGNAIGQVVARDIDQRPTQIVLLNPDSVGVKVDETTGEVNYTLLKTQTPLPAYNVFHVRGMTMPGQKVGLSPIAYAAATLGVDLASRQFASDFFAGGGIPKAVLQTDQAVDQEQARTIKERLLAAVRGREPIVLGRGLTYNTIQVKPEESQFLATQQANVSQIARMFWVPPEMVGGASGNSMTYSNVEQRSLDFLTYGVSFWLKRIEDAFFPLLPKPQYVKFNTTALLRTDAETQAKVDAIRIASKVLPPSRVLTRMDEAPLTEAEKSELELVPLTVTPMGMAKALPNPATPETSDDTPDVTPKLGVVAHG